MTLLDAALLTEAWGEVIGMNALYMGGWIPAPQVIAGATGLDALLAVVVILGVAVALTVALVMTGRPAKAAPIVKQFPVGTYRKAA